jgi:hypothetical protein
MTAQRHSAAAASKTLAKDGFKVFIHDSGKRTVNNKAIYSKLMKCILILSSICVNCMNIAGAAELR